MNRAIMGKNWPIKAQLWRETAHFVGRVNTGDDSLDRACHDISMRGSFSKRSDLNCQYRYPSPRRSAPFGSRPTPPSRVAVVDLRRPSAQIQKPLDLRAQTADSARDKTNQKKGSTPCLKSNPSSPLQLSRRFRRVSTVTSSVALLAPLRARLRLMPLALIQSQARLSAVLLARFATKLRASVAKTSPSPIGTFTSLNRRSGFLLSGGFAFRAEFLGANHV